MTGDAPEYRREGSEAEEIRNIERQRLRVLVEADMEVANQLHADDFQLITPSGHTVSKEQYLGDIASGDVNYLLWEPDPDIQVRLYHEAAIIRYTARIEIIVRGSRASLRLWHTDSYEKRNGCWQVVWSQATEIRS